VFSFNQYTYGNFKETVQKVTVVQRHVVYEAVFASNAQSKYESMVFVGDIMLGRNVEYLSKREGMAYPFSGLNISTLYSNAAVIGNFESSMAVDHVPTEAFTMKFSVPEAALPEIKNAHFTHLSLANNHSFDFGYQGFKNTKDKLLTHSLVPFGNGEKIDTSTISIVSTKRGDIALIGINAVSRIPSDAEVQQVLSQASRRSTFQVVYIHWGNEYERTHSSAQRTLAETLVTAGADLIVGHHPHVTQDIDIIKGVVVFYSLGNYIFDQYFSSDVQEGLVVGLDLTDEPTLTLFPVTSKEILSSPTTMERSEYVRFLEDLAKRSHPSLQDKIKAGSIPLRETVATSTKVAMM
jgi:poly-gamma-glutamate synthesis protein (capsule biosynthesis protein)